MTTLDLDAVTKSVAGQIIQKYPTLSYEDAHDIACMVFDAEGQEMDRLGLLGEEPEGDAATIQ